MKHLATILCVGIIGVAQAQSTSKDVEIYERYENGELVEQRQSATENGHPIKDFDFEKAKREMQLKSAGIEQKMDEMKLIMEQKMHDFEKRSEEMHQRMEQRMKELDRDKAPRQKMKNPELRKTPAPVTRPSVGESTKYVKFT